MKITVLGCSGGEQADSNMPAFLVDDALLLDAGTVSRALNPEKQAGLSDIFITHAHLDHIKALPFLADNLLGEEGPRARVTVHGESRVIRILRDHLFNGLLWPDFSRIPAVDPVLRFAVMEPGRPLRLKGHSVTALPMNHPTPACGFMVEDGAGRRFFYTGDTGPTEEAWKTLKGIPLHALLTEVSYPNRLRERALAAGHLTPELLVGELAKLGRIPDRVFITHAKPAYLDGIFAELSSLGSGLFTFLADGMEIVL